MSCEHSHEHVAVHGRCGGCGQLVTYSGPFDLDTGDGPGWRGAPWTDDADTTCRVLGDHRPDTANGSCGACPTQLDAIHDTTSDQLRWFETPY